MNLKRLFEKKEWKLQYTSATTINGTIECRGNFFQMAYAVFRIMCRR